MQARARAQNSSTDSSSARAVGGTPAAAIKASVSTPSVFRLARSILRRCPKAAAVIRSSARRSAGASGAGRGVSPTRVDATLGGGLGLATMLLGDVTFMSRYVSNTLDAAERQNRMFFYGQDTWRVNAKWTLNYGLRWELYLPETVNNPGAGGWLDLETGLINVAGFGNVGDDGNVSNSWNLFAPRLGIAYQFSQKTIIRMGYGRSFDVGTFGSHFGHAVTQNLPVLATQEARPGTGNAFDAAFTMTAIWEEELLEQYSDTDPQVRDIVRTRNKWIDKVRHFHKTAPGR